MDSVKTYKGSRPGEKLLKKLCRAHNRAEVSLVLGLLLAGCAANETRLGTPSILHPRGFAAARIGDLWWLMFGLGTLVYVVVMGAMLYALFRSRRNMPEEAVLKGTGSTKPLLWGGIIIPSMILFIVFGFTVGTLRAVSTPPGEEALTIEVIGFQWWWEVHYPEQQFYSANEIHIPVGQPVELKLTSRDVIHSFWVPQLHGKMDLNPHRVNTFWIQADQPGEYWGECAEYCGMQHAKMQFVVVAEPPQEFAAWLEQQSQPAPEPADELTQQGREIFLSSSCIYCHRIRGTGATGALGPDLTHLASRLTIGAGAADNNIGNLGGWISDPHSIKPGNLMPPSDLSGEDLQALLAYMQTLR